jgi:hypothetical protein
MDSNQGEKPLTEPGLAQRFTNKEIAHELAHRGERKTELPSSVEALTPDEASSSGGRAIVTSQSDLSRNFSAFWRRLSLRSYSPPPPTRGTFPAQEPMQRIAHALFRTEQAKDLQSLVASKIEEIRHFDVAGMERAVAICGWGRSGSLLLASYLDGHDDVIMLPTLCGDRIYQFFERYQSLSLHDKLIAYPVFSKLDIFTDFFQGEFPIAAADYYAAVDALFEVYGNCSPEFLETRRSFFQFLHVVYCVALGRPPASPHPLIVYAQHAWNDQLARRFVEDFPQARFIHPVRDPITNCGRAFDNRFARNGYERFLTAGYVIGNLTKRDIPHSGMESRTRAIRFEDLHLNLETTMRSVADWLGLPYRSSLLDSTFNGVPYVTERGTVSWSGPRAVQAIRDTRNISFTDRGLLFAVLYEDFVAWNYPCPNIFKQPLVRALTLILVLLVPLKIEIIAARTLIRTLPPLRHGGRRYAINGLVRIVICRIAIISFLSVELWRRLIFGKKVFELL